MQAGWVAGASPSRHWLAGAIREAACSAACMGDSWATNGGQERVRRTRVPVPNMEPALPLPHSNLPQPLSPPWRRLHKVHVNKFYGQLSLVTPPHILLLPW